MMRIGRAAAIAAGLGLAVAACGTPRPEVTRMVGQDEKGRQVVQYKICEKRGLPLLEESVCRVETVTENHCYRSIGRVDCYEQPIVGRAAERTN